VSLTAFPTISNIWSRDFHFLDVGHGDCTIVDIPERLTVIDINNCKTLAKESETELKHSYQSPLPLANPFLRPYGTPTSNLLSVLAQMAESEHKLQAAKEKLTNPVDYLKARFAGRQIFRYIQTHPDMDHMAGIHRLLEEGIEIANLWDTDHCIVKDEDAMRSGEVNHDIRDWHTYQRLRKSVGNNPTVLRLTYGVTGNFWTQDGISIWCPLDKRHSLNAAANPNALSYVLRFDVGKCTVVIGGDATEEMWDEFYRKHGGNLSKVHLLKASHHGRKSGYHREAVKAMNPDVTICSVGELKAKDDAAASYERFSVKGCFSTVDHGDIVAKCWSDGDVWLRERDGDWFFKSFS
jgi:competence protein ComEC